jgi:hypothetical protein
MTLEDLKGNHILSGIEVGTRKIKVFSWEEDCNYIKFILDGTTYLAVENPDDGYRSYMEELQIVDEKCEVKLPDIEVCCHMRENGKYEENDILVFIDSVNGEEILVIGTGNTDDYYPYCVMEYSPEKMHCNIDRRC